MAISGVIKSIRDIMRKDRGINGDAQRIEQLVWMIFLKVFDDKEKEWGLEEGYISIIPEKFRWRSWAANNEGITGEELLKFIEEMFKKLKEISATPDGNPKGFIVKSLFEDSINYMKNGVLIRQVINKLNQIDFNKSEDRHLFNDIYEGILKELQSAGDYGEFYTPRPVTRFIVDMVGPKTKELLLDPACGTGGFLTSSIDYLKKNVKNIDEHKLIEKNVLGSELKPLPHLLCTTNLILHDIEVPNVEHKDSLGKPLVGYGPSDMVNVIVTNPPFGGAIEPGVELNFPSLYRTKETAYLFVVLIMKLLRDEGRCGIVLPDGGLMTGDGVAIRIKDKLLSGFNLHTIIKLPNGVFSPYTDINTNLLFFKKGEPTKDIWYFEHPLPEGYKKYTKTKPIRYSEFGLEKEWWNNREDVKFSQYCWKVSMDEIKNKNYNLDSKNPHVIEEEKQLSKEEIISKIEKNMNKTQELLKLIQEAS
ncbi:SAM-dependent DNA methyltransferase [Candidatus Woesearchaeota archaeon]|nr:SAM-dependent DNA methyltransferase [Candidatus Woesearchaeota archaeon]MBT5342706.1 SAM-dependent DNA methyltransferase [Candidatus Woesearchaeota archaeon]